LKDFLDIIIENATRSGKAWSLGEYPAETDDKYKTLTYSQTNCLNVLQNLCKEWGVEFLITRDGATRALDIKVQIGELFPQRFEYGRTGGAYKIERKTVSNQNVITRLFVFGSDKNLPSDYRSNKLCLPGKTRNESYITDEESVRFYGIKENVKVFADIYPARYGTVTAVDVSNKKIFFDSSMDFDLNETNEYGTKWLIPSTVAKIQFNSGGLAGYSFDLTEYDHATKRFKIKTYTDANGLQFPNDSSAAFQIKAGDEYFIYDIRMPQSYIDAAEAKLQAEGEKFYEENCRPHVNYAISISSLFLKHLYGDTKLTNEIFKVGDSIEIYDYDLDLLKTLRIAGFTRNLMNPYEFTLTIAENVEVQTQFQRVMRELTDIRSLVYTNDITAADNARRNWLATQDVLNSVFDPEGHYYSEKIKPLSIETTMLAVGARSQQFILKNVNFEPNYHGDPNAIHSTAGTLEHYTIAEPDIRTWQINQSTATDLAPNTVYYIYAKCPRDGDTGFILYDNAQHTVESDPQFYHFLIGTLTTVLSDVNGNRPARNIALTYGSTSINGRFINTGRIESADKSVYIDLDNNEISGRFNFKDGLISNVIGIGQDASDAQMGLGGKTTHPLDRNYQKYGKKIALWASRLYQSTSLENIAADTVLLEDGTLRIGWHSNYEDGRIEAYGPVLVVDPVTRKVIASYIQTADLKVEFDAQMKNLNVSQRITTN
ncbi:MAG: phage tail protein, partial [Bacteroidales bacterium]|nr:phage tail protein [Bacteroidales bacterium]